MILSTVVRAYWNYFFVNYNSVGSLGGRGFETFFRGDGTRPFDKNVIVVNIIIAEKSYPESAIYVIS